MKPQSIIILLIFVLISCTPQMQLVTLESEVIDIDKEGLVYQDSIIKLSYDFYSPSGVMSFQIVNNFEEPIYIDWKNSIYIRNNKERIPYWADESELAANLNAGSIHGNIIKRERISFLPPNTELYMARFILASEFFDMNNSEVSMENKTWRESNKKIKVYHSSYNEENTPLDFRNFITISLTEDFADPIYYDFRFWISDLIQANAKQIIGDHFYLTYMDSISNPNFHPYKLKNRFFIIEK